MARFNISITFGLSTTIEPDFPSYSFDAPSGAEEFSDDSYFGSGEDVEVNGGEITFVIEAEDEDEAEAKASEVVEDGSEVEDNNGYTWVVQDVEVSVERQEMSVEVAVAIVRAWLRESGESAMPTEIREALDVILATMVARLGA